MVEGWGTRQGCFFFSWGERFVTIVVHAMHHRACDEIFFFLQLLLLVVVEKGIGNRKMHMHVEGGIPI